MVQGLFRVAGAQGLQLRDALFDPAGFQQHLSLERECNVGIAGLLPLLEGGAELFDLGDRPSALAAVEAENTAQDTILQVRRKLGVQRRRAEAVSLFGGDFAHHEADGRSDAVSPLGDKWRPKDEVVFALLLGAF